MGLVDRFAVAGLELEIAGEPLRDVRNPEVFQMDVARRRRRRESTGREVFRIWPGHAGNRVEAVGLDAGERQLVLMVHEPSREVVVTVHVQGVIHDGNREPWIHRTMNRYGVTRKQVEVTSDRTLGVRRLTPDLKRHYLCGLDERQLFIAELPRAVSTVREAHRALAPTSLHAAAGRRVVRQGEWFFVEPTVQELEDVRTASHLVERKAPCGSGGGRPHVVDEAITVPRSKTRYVRGAVRHPDHRTLQLRGWHRVVLNRESRVERVTPETNAWMGRILWVD